MKLIAPYTLFENAAFKPLTDLLLLANAERTWNQGIVTVELTDDSLVTIDALMAWATYGGEALNPPCFIKIPIAKYEETIPVGVPYRTSTAEDGTVTEKKWSEWHIDNQQPAIFSDFVYIENDDTGYPLKASELLVVHGLTDIEVITKAEFNTIQAAQPSNGPE